MRVSKFASAALGAFGFLLILLCEPSFAQEWVKPSAGRPEYVQDRIACVQEAQSMAIVDEAFDRDVGACLLSKGWQRNRSHNRMPVYCADKEAAISCKPGGTEEMYKKDRAECVTQTMQTVGNRYSRPGWWGLGGLIVSAIQAEENKANLRKTQLHFMQICLEGKNWTVELKTDSKTEPSESSSARPSLQPVDDAATLAQQTPPVSNASGVTPAKGIPGESKFMFEAERLAKSSGCPQPIAAMNFKDSGSELFTVVCPTGDQLSMRCD